MIDLFDDALPYALSRRQGQCEVLVLENVQIIKLFSSFGILCILCIVLWINNNFHIDHSESVRTFCVFFHCVICTEIRRLQSF